MIIFVLKNFQDIEKSNSGYKLKSVYNLSITQNELKINNRGKSTTK